MVEVVLALVAVAVFAFVLGVAIPALTQSEAGEPQKNPHFTRRVFGMHKK